MAFIEIEEMKSAIYQYQLEQISDGDDTIIIMGIDTAIEEVKSYLTPNSQHEYRDGRLIYDAEAIFSATGTDRNALILSITKTVAEWWVTQLCNADIIYEQLKERYTFVTKWLVSLQKGEVNLSSLPQLDLFGDANPDAPTLHFGSRTKFNHE